MDFDFLSFVLGIVVGLFIAYSIARILGRLLYNKLVAEGVLKSAEEEADQTDTKRIDMKVEKHGDMLYAFRSDNDGFVCQGTDLKELKQNFVERFPGLDGSVVGKTEEVHKELLEQKKGLKNESGPSIGSTP